ncbi:hypothetical protein NSPZN2_70024 [Nitrospira defluvii]|uniref:Uncharacterized protein n=1 Tax=Nitrospira defluvii TaxID=330214 RepID=A0ABN7MG07_9BACT|nr:hypothetical protein NSPZN2_70024 [Nitrospira defluvii]
MYPAQSIKRFDLGRSWWSNRSPCTWLASTKQCTTAPMSQQQGCDGNVSLEEDTSGLCETREVRTQCQLTMYCRNTHQREPAHVLLNLRVFRGTTAYGEEQLGIIHLEGTDSEALAFSQTIESICKPLFVYNYNVLS